MGAREAGGRTKGCPAPQPLQSWRAEKRCSLRRTAGEVWANEAECTSLARQLNMSLPHFLSRWVRQQHAQGMSLRILHGLGWYFRWCKG